MISLETINSEILELEKKDTSYAVIERLAWLYVVKDHMTEEIQKVKTSNGSEFVLACNGVPIESVIEIMDNYMEELKAIYPKEYESILRKLKS